MMERNKIKVCFVASFAYAFFNLKTRVWFGGSELQLFFQALELAKDAEFDVAFIVGDFGRVNATYQNIRVIKGFKLGGWTDYLFQSIRFFRVLVKTNPDILITRAASPELAVLALYKLLFKKKLIYQTASSIDVDGGYLKVHPIKGLFYLFGLKRADLVLAQSRQHKRMLKQYYQKNSLVFQNVFPMMRCQKIQRRYILWVGSSQKLKQPQLFLELAKHFPNEKFIMIMPSHFRNEGLRQTIVNKAQAIRNLSIIDKVSFNKISLFFQRAKIFINTSIYEGFPNTFVQAMIAATPIVSLNVNPDRFLDKFKCGFCAGASFSRMLRQIKTLIEDKALWLEISKNALRYAKKNHNIKKNIIFYKKTIRSLMKT